MYTFLFQFMCLSLWSSLFLFWSHLLCLSQFVLQSCPCNGPCSCCALPNSCPQCFAFLFPSKVPDPCNVSSLVPCHVPCPVLRLDLLNGNGNGNNGNIIVMSFVTLNQIVCPYMPNWYISIYPDCMSESSLLWLAMTVQSHTKMYFQ